MSDYPHLRGEHSSEASTSPARCGPSPRAWGALHVDTARPSLDGTIPTCVGSTTRSP
ncbi:hypothetical protein Tfu_1256 [Thermobifida fusca YX]|nr:hypothetical protein Tfu_1256 [Thermobifida fusca YX]